MGFSRVTFGWLGRGQRPLALALLLLVGVMLGVGFGSLVGGSKRPDVKQVAPTQESPQTPLSAPSSLQQAPAPAPTETAPVPAQSPTSSPAAPLQKLAVPPEHGPYVATAIPDARVVAPLPSARDGAPPWLAYAVPMTADSRPMIAIVIDDLGLDRRRSARIVELRGPLTLSFLPYAQDLPTQTAQGRAKGHELLVHVPMEPVGANYDPGPESNLLKVGLTAGEIRARLERDLAQFSGFVGVNNHMGSKFTADRAGMRVALAELHDRGLLFLDSRTSAQSVGAEVAREIGLPFAERNVFLDNVPSLQAVDDQLEKVEAYARQYGHAIAIGHPHDGTIEALAVWLPTLEAKGFALAPLSAIVKRQATLAAAKAKERR